MKSKAEVTPSSIRILKIGTCPSISGKSKLLYHVGCTAESEIKFRVVSNDGGGYHSDEWVPLTAIQQVFAKLPGDKPITSFLLNPIFEGKSVNTAAFLLAVLKSEGLVQPHKEKRRCYECTDAKGFIAETKALIASAVDLKPDDKPAKTDSKGTTQVKVKGAKVEAKSGTIAAVLDPQGASITKQPWPIKKPSGKAATKKA